MAENKTLEHLPEVRAAVTALSPEDRELLAAVQSDEWNHERPAEPEKKPSIRDRLTQAKEQAAEKTEHRTIDREKVKVKDRSVQR